MNEIYMWRSYMHNVVEDADVVSFLSKIRNIISYRYDEIEDMVKGLYEDDCIRKDDEYNEIDVRIYYEDMPFYIEIEENRIVSIRFFDFDCFSKCEWEFFEMNRHLIGGGLLYKAHRSARWVSSRQGRVLLLFKSLRHIIDDEEFIDGKEMHYWGVRGNYPFRNVSPINLELVLRSMIGIYGIRNLHPDCILEKNKYECFYEIKNVLPDCKPSINENRKILEDNIVCIIDNIIFLRNNNINMGKNIWEYSYISNIIKKYNNLRLRKLHFNEVFIGDLDPDLNFCNL